MDQEHEHERVPIFEALKMVARNPGLTHGEARLWLAYRSHEGEAGGVVVDDEVASGELGVSARQVRAYRAGLRRKGFLRQVLRGPRPPIYLPVLPSEKGRKNPATLDEREEESRHPSAKGRKEGRKKTSTLPHTPSNRESEKESVMGSELDVYGGQLPKPANLVGKGDSNHLVYPPSFESVWNAYPSRGEHANPKKAAYRVWRTAVTNGTDPETLLKATRHYAQAKESDGEAGTKYVKQARTFFGPDDHWREHLEPPKSKPKGGGGQERCHLSAQEVEERFGDG